MLEWLLKGFAAVAGLAAIWFGVNARRTKLRMESEAAARDEAERDYLEKKFRNIARAHRENAGKAPIRADKRTDFE